jgi:transcriptional regulator with XRE-family HTH domain
MAKKVGTLIKEARTAAGLTQEQLARKVADCSASDLSKAERGEKELTQTQLKAIAKATGVTQKSLLDAAKGTTGGAKTTTAKKTAARTPAKTPAKTSAKTAGSTANRNTVTVTAAEKKLLELYRAADSDTKKAAVAILRGEQPDSGDKTVLDGLLGTALDVLSNLGK